MKSTLPLYARSAILRGVVFMTALVLLTAFALWREHEQALDYARKSAAATVALMEQHTLATFRVVELALVETTGTLAAGDHGMRHDPAMRESMRRRLKDMPYVRALFVIGADGIVQHDTDWPATPDVTLADREYFKAHLRDPKLETGVWSPVLSRSGTGWFIPVTRRIGPPGEFRGVAVAAIQLRYFSELYERIGMGPGRIVLFHRDGTLLAQYPPDDKLVGANFAHYPLFTEYLPKSGSGVYATKQPPYNFERLVSYRAVPGEPLVVLVSQDMDAILAPWRRTLLGASLALLALLVMTVYAVRAYNRNAAERQRSRERMAQGEKLEAIGRLTGSVAHDFGNVLGIINNSLAMLEKLPQGADDKVRQCIDVSRRALATGTQLTRDLMSFTRQRELKLESVDLGEAVEQMLPILQQAGGRTKVELQREPGVARCELDTTQLQVALINLVVNARDAMSGAGQVTLRVFGTTRPEPRRRALFARARMTAWVGLTVADTGIGMSEEVRRRALEPFFTTKGEQGTGLGLAQVHSFMHQLGGEVAIDSAPARGTQVRLYFRASAA